MKNFETSSNIGNFRKRYPDANFVDIYPFIWNNFSDAGYVTLYGEDAAGIGTFTYRLKGFKKQPTNHYTRTFFHKAEPYEQDWKCIGPDSQVEVFQLSPFLLQLSNFRSGSGTLKNSKNDILVKSQNSC